MGCGLLCAALLPVACAVRGVVMRESLVPPSGFNDENRMEPANAWGDAAGCDYFVTSRRRRQGRGG